MYKQFKSTKVAFWILFSAIIVLMVTLSFESTIYYEGKTVTNHSLLSQWLGPNIYREGISPLSITALLLIILHEGMNWVALKRYNKVKQQAYDTCKFEQYYLFLKTSYKKRTISRQNNLLLLFDLIHVNILLGFFDDALELLPLFDFISKKSNYYMNFYCLFYRFKLYCFLHNTVKMKDTYTALDAYASIIPEKKSKKIKYLPHIMQLANAMLNVENGEFSSAVTMYQTNILSSKSLHDRVFFTFLLSTAYQKQNQTEKAKEGFLFVAEKARDTFLAKEALVFLGK